MTLSYRYYDTVMTEAQRRLSREDVLAVAEDLLTRTGPQGLSVRQIADALGVSRQIVYSRFTGKPDLVRALHNEGFRRLAEHFAAVPEPAGSTAHMLAMARAYRNCALASPALYGLMFGRPIPEFEPDDQARAVAEASFQPVVEAARSWLLANTGSATDSAALGLALRVWATTHGVVSLEAAGLLGDEAPAMIDSLISAILAARGGTAEAHQR
jgi:AcrR family transcriptional regulator